MNRPLDLGPSDNEGDDNHDNDDANNNNNNNNVVNEEEDAQLEEFLSHILHIARNHAANGQQEELDLSQVMDRTRARNLLEAMAGNVHGAVQLYWDDFLARNNDPHRPAAGEAAVSRNQPNNNNNNNNEHGNKRNEAGNEQQPQQPQQRAVLDDDDDEAQVPEMNLEMVREFRRRLFGHGIAEYSSQQQQRLRSAGQMVAAGAVHPRNPRVRARVLDLFEQEEDDDGSNDDPEQDRIPNRIHDPNQNYQNYHHNHNNSISDEEGGGGGTTVRQSQKVHNNNNHRSKRRKKENQTARPENHSPSDDDTNQTRYTNDDMDSCNTHDDEDDGYISENDWIWDFSEHGRNTSSLSDPTRLLWGTGKSATPTTAALLSGTQSSVTKKPAVVDDMVPASSTDDGVAKTTKKPGIPRTWLNAGFTPSVNPQTSILGLAVAPPNENDIAHHIWRNALTEDSSAGGGARPNAHVPLPYHCRSVTAILSVVTALLYSGAALQGEGHVSCTSFRRPLMDVIHERNKKMRKKLDQQQKNKNQKGDSAQQKKNTSPDEDHLWWKREFDARLADVLSALLYIAAKSSLDRKRRALEKLRTSMDLHRWNKMERKLKLCPTCWWESDGSGGVKPPVEDEENPGYCRVQIMTSYTNIQDLRKYVVANMRAFTSSGGCALFLETLVRIHGSGALRRQLKRLAPRYGSNSSMSHLLHCSCDQRHHALLDADPQLAKQYKANFKKHGQLDTTPLVRDCLSIELLSLLLTGRIHSTLTGWSTGETLGVGILSDGPIGRGLTRPERPSWIVRGPTCYSVLWLHGCNDDNAKNFSKFNRPGSVASLMHWNCWCGQERQHDTQLHMVLKQSECHSSNNNVSDNSADNNVLNRELRALPHNLQVLARLRHERELLDKATLHSVESMDPEQVVTKEDMDRVTANPEDQVFYRGKHRMWRYHFQPCGDENQPHPEDDEMDAKRPAVPSSTPTWKTFYSLTQREKWIVETKYGPKLSTLLWTRWPKAVIDRVVPEDPQPVV